MRSHPKIKFSFSRLKIKLPFSFHFPKLNILSFLRKSKHSIVIAIDSENSLFHFYSMIDNNKNTIAHHIKGYGGMLFDEDFFKKFKVAVKEFVDDNPSDSIRKVTVIIPDSAVLNDTVKIPTLKGLGQTKKALAVTLGGFYRNYADLRISSRVAYQNRQYSTFAISAVQRHIVASIFATCSENKLLVDTLTYTSGATISGAVQFNPKLKNGSYLFLDMKDLCSRFVFVVNGKALGHYVLPFGLEFLKKPKLTQEDMLFDHSYAELAVLNAREKAKSKKLTVMAVEEEYDEDLQDFNEENEGAVATAENVTVDTAENTAVETTEYAAEEDTVVRAQINQKVYTRKAPRKLPKFMQREVPETEEGIAAENFRVFVKWALTLIQSNEKLTEISKPNFVCVNIPHDLEFVLEYANREAEENGIIFTNLPHADTEAAFLSNIELYGGLFTKHIGAPNKF